MSAGSRLARSRCRLFLLTAVAAAPTTLVQADATELPVQQLLQTAAYIGVDYRGAVVNGTVADANEYAEMGEFATTLAKRHHGVTPVIGVGSAGK